ncbi:N-acetylmuramoyl-L-alanine amidase [Aliikangiella marina]|uniref:N-acetylmuramoyl-L-alanine amidase n=1 Tax=Aliikangiella marina TaxID=1712262 RepID=A0A545T2U0_9GAMM|nr:peptidoglycan recognition family protein [Aliikangiella marina]TQV71534.1 N-acetylmuramoyl-L-alanine amidase [Aliikangiella marina]
MSSKHCQQNDMPDLVGEQIANSHTENKNANNSKGFSRRKFLQLSAIGLIGVGISGWYWPNRWRYIVIHHSAGNYGNIKFLQKIHRERQAGDPVDAIPYHFIVGNGNGMAMGEIASDWRQENHLWGAHVSARNRDRNYRGLGICMIGNFEINPVPEPQFQSLVSLCQQLVTRYDIPKTHISGHGLTPGEQTLCPGKHFPMSRLLDSLS